MKPDIRN